MPFRNVSKHLRSGQKLYHFSMMLSTCVHMYAYAKHQLRSTRDGCPRFTFFTISNIGARVENGCNPSDGKHLSCVHPNPFYSRSISVLLKRKSIKGYWFLKFVICRQSNKNMNKTYPHIPRHLKQINYLSHWKGHTSKSYINVFV